MVRRASSVPPVNAPFTLQSPWRTPWNGNSTPPSTSFRICPNRAPSRPPWPPCYSSTPCTNRPPRGPIERPSPPSGILCAKPNGKRGPDSVSWEQIGEDLRSERKWLGKWGNIKQKVMEEEYRRLNWDKIRNVERRKYEIWGHFMWYLAKYT